MTDNELRAFLALLDDQAERLFRASGEHPLLASSRPADLARGDGPPGGPIPGSFPWRLPLIGDDAARPKC